MRRYCAQIALITVLILTAGTTVVALAGCSSGVSTPWACECQCDEGRERLRCTGVTMDRELDLSKTGGGR